MPFFSFIIDCSNQIYKKDEYIKAFGGIEMLKYDIKVQKVLEILRRKE